MQARIEEQRRKMGGVNAARENNQQVQKHIKILENRLDKALQRYNEAVAHNRSLRSAIDDLRRERLVFEGIYRKLERELMDKRKELTNINGAHPLSPPSCSPHWPLARRYRNQKLSGRVQGRAS